MTNGMIMMVNGRMQPHLPQRGPTRLAVFTMLLLSLWCASVWRMQEQLSETTRLTSSTAWAWQETSRMDHQRALLPRDKTRANQRDGSTATGETSKSDELLQQEEPVVEIHCTNCTRYIVFKPIPYGQGTGQAMNGLLAAHLLADEFDRVVCVTPSYEPFHIAFEPVHPQAVRDCPTLKLNPRPKLISLINYHSAPDECRLKDALESDLQIVYIVGNTYPQWRTVPGGYFPRFYKPTSTLHSMLPWKDPPNMVVHLRKADREVQDFRAGLDTKTLKALGEALPSNTFLVTNSVSWFDFFSGKYHWSHPNWRAVQHSAFRKLLWGQSGREELSEQDRSQEVQNLQMWSDWYTIVSAKQVWHTHSDFSLSAIHWMNVESKTITGVDESGKLMLIDEPWRRESPLPPLKDRTPEDLQNCKAAKPTVNVAIQPKQS